MRQDINECVVDRSSINNETIDSVAANAATIKRSASPPRNRPSFSKITHNFLFSLSLTFSQGLCFHGISKLYKSLNRTHACV